MCVAGGRRCDYSDKITNVRRKARNKAIKDNPYTVEREIQKAVRKFQEENPQLVREHLPEKMGFQYTPPKWEVPSSLLEQLGNLKDPATGYTGEEKDIFYKSLHSRRNEWWDKLELDEENALSIYTMDAFESINSHLRRHGYAEWARGHRHLFHHQDINGSEYLREVVKKRIKDMDNALKKAVPAGEPEKLYRFYRVPAGVTPAIYMKKYFQPGGGFKDKGYLSTSADPEYIASHIINRSGGTRNKGYIVLEMLTSAGGSVQPRPRPEPGKVQSLEAEVLLPRNTGMRIIDTGKKDFLFSGDRKDLEMQYGIFGSRPDFSAGNGIKLPVVRMIDESLIRETRKG